MAAFISHSPGERFGRLTVVSRAQNNKNGGATWKCVCDCGNETSPYGAYLRNGSVQSCGCLNSENRVLSGRKNRKLSVHDSALRAWFLKYAARAASYKREFSLSEDEFNAIVSKSCHYCGERPSERMTHHHTPTRSSKSKNPSGAFVNGVDRVDSNLGYTASNCVPCCGRCNKAKLDLTTEEFKDMIKAQYDHFINPTTEVNLIGILGSVDELIRFHREAA